MSVEASRIVISKPKHPALYLCDLHTLGGYDTVLNRVDVIPEAVALHKKPICSQAALRPFIDETIALIAAKAPAHNFRQHVRFRDVWMTNGASTHGSPTVLQTARGKKIRVAGKLGSTAGMTDQQLVDLAWRYRPAIDRVFRKEDEVVKTRAVHSYDLGSFLRCDYAGQFLKNLNGNAQWTTLGMGPRQRFEVRKRLRELSRMQGFFLCTDQSAFDNNQSKENVAYAIEKLFDHAIASASPGQMEDLRHIKRVELDSFDRCVIVDEKKNVVSPWMRGVPSGHRWTALIDSILNRAMSLYVAQSLNLDVIQGYYQGDDAVMRIRGTRPDPEKVGAVYRSLGMAANPLKTWVHPENYEFLHEFETPFESLAMPARMMKSLIWKKPSLGVSNFVTGEQRIKDTWEIFAKANRRGLVVYDAIKHVLTRHLRRAGVSRPHAASLSVLNTPVYLGGLGWGTGGRLALKYITNGPRQALRILTPVRFTGITQAVASDYIIRRVNTVVPLPGYGTKVFVEKIPPQNRVPLPPATPSSVRVQWTLADRVKDPFKNKLILEHRIRRSLDIHAHHIPDSPLRYLKPRVLTTLVPYIIRMQGWVANFSTCISSAEPWAQLSDLAGGMWNTVLNTAVFAGRKILLPDARARSIAHTLWSRFRSLAFSPVRV